MAGAALSDLVNETSTQLKEVRADALAELSGTVNGISDKLSRAKAQNDNLDK